MKTRPLATIDIGTNTLRLLIAEIGYNSGKKNYTIHEVYSERVITRLGEGLPEGGLMRDEAITRSLAVLQKFSETLSHYGVGKTAVVATSALREAKNSTRFLQQAKESSGLDINIISGEEEAKKTAAGMMIDLCLPQTAFMVDIGGGSTELIFSRQRQPLLVQSLNVGVVYLTERYMKQDPPAQEDLKLMGNEISLKIKTLAGLFKKLLTNSTAFIGTAGTVTALSAITQKLTRFEHKKIHNTKITKEQVKDIFSKISHITSRERAQYLPFEPQRLDIIVPGTFILLTLMEEFGFQELIVSNFGLREGILIELYEENIQKT
jgi:exopolyphosphatase/guanosine-5'-triphosphate,3'-diphosphate pyrophosphatase